MTKNKYDILVILQSDVSQPYANTVGYNSQACYHAGKFKQPQGERGR